MSGNTQINKTTKSLMKEIIQEIVESDKRIHTLNDVKINVEQDKVIIDVYVIVCFDEKIPELAWDLQSNIKETLEKAVKVKIKAVNFHIHGVKFRKEEENV